MEGFGYNIPIKGSRPSVVFIHSKNETQYLMHA
jgi:hypothetical protein